MLGLRLNPGTVRKEKKRVQSNLEKRQLALYARGGIKKVREEKNRNHRQKSDNGTFSENILLIMSQN